MNLPHVTLKSPVMLSIIFDVKGSAIILDFHSSKYMIDQIDKLVVLYWP